MSGTALWFSIGGEIYYEDARDRVLDRPLPLVAQSRWFCDSTRPLAKMPTEEVPDPPAMNFLVLSENQLRPPSSINELPTVDHGARLSLNVEPDSDPALFAHDTQALRRRSRDSAGGRAPLHQRIAVFVRVLCRWQSDHDESRRIHARRGGARRRSRWSALRSCLDNPHQARRNRRGAANARLRVLLLLLCFASGNTSPGRLMHDRIPMTSGSKLRRPLRESFSFEAMSRGYRAKRSETTPSITPSDHPANSHAAAHCRRCRNRCW